MAHEPITVFAVVKNLAYVPAILVGLSLHSYGILAIFLILDIITGIWRSAAINGGSSITSWKAINGFMSKFLFLLIPVVLAWAGQGVGLNLVALAQSALGVLILSTGYSIIGNIYTVRTGNAVKEFDAVRIILLQIENLLKRIEPPTK